LLLRFLTQVEVATLTLVGEMSVNGPILAENRPSWYNPIGILAFSLSLAVNTIFTGLLVFKIAKSSMALRHTHTRGIQDFTPLITMLIESGLIFFMAQLVWVVCFNLESSAFDLISGPLTIIYVRAYLRIYFFRSFFYCVFYIKGIIPTTIVVRVAMAGTANKTRNKSSTAESNMEFALTDDNLPTIRVSSLGESKETIV
jgi:hypothetical protein